MARNNGRAAKDQDLVVELTNIAYCDIHGFPLNCRDGPIGENTLRWLFCAAKQRRTARKTGNSAAFQSAEPSTAQDFRGGRDVDGC
jgi:hypothetical protein